MKQIETPKNAGLVLPTPFGTPSDKHTIWVSESAISELQGHVGGRNILQGHRPALGAGGRLTVTVKFHRD